MELKEYKPIKIPTYNLPLYKRVAKHYNVCKYIFGAVLYALIILIALWANSWNAIWLLYFLPFEILLVYCVVRLFTCYHHGHKYAIWREEMKETQNHASIYSGPPGSCKSLTACYSVEAMQEGSWQELQFEYWLLCSRLTKKDYVMTDDDREIFDTYRYYVEHDGVPCLATNIPFYSYTYKRFSYKFGPSYLKQERRLPYRLSGLYDEIGTVFNPQLAHDKGDKMKSLEMADTARFCRHFAELRFIGTEQDPNNVYINIRRDVGLNRVYLGKKLILKPKFLNWIYDKLKNHFLRHMSVKEARLFAGSVLNLKKFINNIGYFKIRYKDIANTETGTYVETVKRNGDVIYLPCASNFKYDTRAFRAAYKARNMPIVMGVFTSMRLEDKEAETFLRANYKQVDSD